ncbi:Rieske (2Fe-2S) protein [Streptomyces sp. NPDC001606]
MTQSATRRTVLATGAAALAVGCTGCGGSTSSSAAPPAASGGQKSGPTLARTSEIPEGGGKIFKDRKVVVTQPSKGQFKAFSAICTHMGCTVAQVTNGTIVCPCHGSKYRIADGSVVQGPATEPLPKESIRVEGHSIHLA